MKKLTFLIFSIWIGAVQAQDKPSIFPSQLEAATNLQDVYSRPGVRNQSRSRGLELSFRTVSGSVLEKDKDPNSSQYVPAATDNLNNLVLKVRFPILNKPDFKIIAGYTHERENYNFGRLGERNQELYKTLDESVFKRNAFNLFLNKPLNDRYYLVLTGQMAFNANHENWINFDRANSNLLFIGAFVNKRSEDFEWGVGGAFVRNLEKNNRLLPLLIFNKNISEKWGVEGALPISFYLRHNVKDGSILMAGMDFSSQAYALNNTNFAIENDYILDHSELLATVMLEQRIVPWIWLDVQAGYQLNFNNNLSVNGREDLLVQFDPTDALFFKVGIFVSPPDKFME